MPGYASRASFICPFLNSLAGTTQHTTPAATASNVPILNSSATNAALLARFGLGGTVNLGASAATTTASNQGLLGLVSTGQQFQQQLGNPQSNRGNLGMSQSLNAFQQPYSQEFLRNLLVTRQSSNLVLERALFGSTTSGALDLLLRQKQGPPLNNISVAMFLALQQQQQTGSMLQAQQAEAAPLPAPIPRPLSHRVDNSRTKRILLYVPSDNESLSPYQCFARQNIELFEAREVDVQTGAQGRNKQVQLGQVGIRCIHCADLHPKLRTRAAVYYPSRLGVLYQVHDAALQPLFLTVIAHHEVPEACRSVVRSPSPMF